MFAFSFAIPSNNVIFELLSKYFNPSSHILLIKLVIVIFSSFNSCLYILLRRLYNVVINTGTILI